MLWPMEIAHNSFYPFLNPLLILEWTMSELKITSKIRNYFSKNISINFQYFSIQRKHQSVTYSFFFYSRKKTICKINMQQLKETYCLPEAIEWRASNLIVTDGFLISLAQSTLFPLFALQYSYLLVSGCVFLEFDQEVNKRSESLLHFRHHGRCKDKKSISFSSMLVQHCWDSLNKATFIIPLSCLHPTQRSLRKLRKVSSLWDYSFITFEILKAHLDWLPFL